MHYFNQQSFLNPKQLKRVIVHLFANECTITLFNFSGSSTLALRLKPRKAAEELSEKT